MKETWQRGRTGCQDVCNSQCEAFLSLTLFGTKLANSYTGRDVPQVGEDPIIDVLAQRTD
jgi:hypothetical protein